MADPTPRLQLVELEEKQQPLSPDLQEVLDKILDPLARRVFEEKLRAGVADDEFTIPQGPARE